MTHTLVVHVRTTQDPVQRLSAPLIQSYTGGLRVSIEARARAPSPPGVMRFRADQLEDAHATAASAPCCVVDVAEDCRSAFMRFLRDCPGTASDFTACVLTTTPNESSQVATIEATNELSAAGMMPAQLRLILAGASRDQPSDTSFGLLAQFCAQHGSLDHWRMGVALRDLPALQHLQRDHVELGDVLHGTLDFQAELEKARRAGAGEEALRALMRKVLSQRMVLGIAEEIGSVLDALSLPRIASLAWREESERFAAARRGKLAPSGPAIADPVRTSPGGNEATQAT
jgi:hypothetical protein